ncbi:unnamed protein product [Chrysoparadoxa australica]
MYQLMFASGFWRFLGSRSFVSNLSIMTRVVGLVGLRTRFDLICGQFNCVHSCCQIYGAQCLRSMPLFPRELSYPPKFGH